MSLIRHADPKYTWVEKHISMYNDNLLLAVKVCILHVPVGRRRIGGSGHGNCILHELFSFTCRKQ